MNNKKLNKFFENYLNHLYLIYYLKVVHLLGLLKEKKEKV